jgi:hypothetical protein
MMIVAKMLTGCMISRGSHAHALKRGGAEAIAKPEVA